MHYEHRHTTFKMSQVQEFQAINRMKVLPISPPSSNLQSAQSTLYSSPISTIPSPPSVYFSISPKSISSNLTKGRKLRHPKFSDDEDDSEKDAKREKTS
jgi:hypothetical protein